VKRAGSQSSKSKPKIQKPVPKNAIPQLLYDRRKVTFIQSLQKILQTISSDQFIETMFSDEESRNFISDRICEITHNVLKSDQEKALTELESKVAAFEAGFGLVKSAKIVPIGNQILTLKAQGRIQKVRELRD